jgi:hypothetical protein
VPTHHHLAATPENIVWGYFDATRAPALTIDSGDTVTIDAIPAGDWNDDLPPDRARLLPDHLKPPCRTSRAGPGRIR